MTATWMAETKQSALRCFCESAKPQIVQTWLTIVCCPLLLCKNWACGLQNGVQGTTSLILADPQYSEPVCGSIRLPPRLSMPPCTKVDLLNHGLGTTVRIRRWGWRQKTLSPGNYARSPWGSPWTSRNFSTWHFKMMKVIFISRIKVKWKS